MKRNDFSVSLEHRKIGEIEKNFNLPDRTCQTVNTPIPFRDCLWSLETWLN